MRPLFHIVARDAWPAAGEYRPASLAGEGFVHCSYAEQVAGTLDRYYRDVPDLIVVELDPEQLGPVRIENGFPHVYAALPVSAAVGIHPPESFRPDPS